MWLLVWPSVAYVLAWIRLSSQTGDSDCCCSRARMFGSETYLYLSVALAGWLQSCSDYRKLWQETATHYESLCILPDPHFMGEGPTQAHEQMFCAMPVQCKYSLSCWAVESPAVAAPCMTDLSVGYDFFKKK